jgi:hypothetical protein
VVERLRALLERPIDPPVARATLALAVATSVGFAIVALLGGIGDRPSGRAQTARTAPVRAEAVEQAGAIPAPSSGMVSRQDAQDRAGTRTHRRASREVAEHRALQHVPYRAGGVSIELVGAERGRAVLLVKAPTVAAARRGWGRFLRRFDDPGRAYLPRFEGSR